MHSGKPCRTCTDFKSWVKVQQKESTKTENTGSPTLSTMSSSQSQSPGQNGSGTVTVEKEVVTVAEETLPRHCPLDKDQLGRNTWSFLHTMTAYYPETPTNSQQEDMNTFLRIFSRFYPCSYCAEDLRKDLEVLPPVTDSRQNLSQWLCKLHNIVNEKLGKPLFNCTTVDERWLTGPPDGSCDI